MNKTSETKSNNNLILTKRDLVLLKKSEEVKKVEIYGNLYECLEPYTTLSHKDLQKDIVFDDKARMILIHNVKEMMEHIQEEWYAKTSSEIATTEVHCQLCGAKNTYVCYIENRLNGEELHVGSQCINHFKDINGANVILAKIRAEKRDATKEARRSNFDVSLGNNIDFTKIAREKLDTFPILLPYKLHVDLENGIKDCNRIRTSYISSGGNIDDCINKFHLKIAEFKELYQKAETYYIQNKNNPLICTRKIANWLKNNYPTIIVKIQKANGILNENTLQYVYEPHFIKKNLPIFSKCIKDKDVEFLNVNGNTIQFKIENDRFPQPINFTMPIKNFMMNIGCYCLTQAGYKFSKLNLSPSIENNSSNFKNVFNYFTSVLRNTMYTIILEEKTSQLYWSKKQIIASRWSNRSLNPLFKEVKTDNIFNIMSSILLIDKTEKEIVKIITSKIEMSGKWITKEEKDRNVQIASEAAGMQKQREFTPYL